MSSVQAGIQSLCGCSLHANPYATFQMQVSLSSAIPLEIQIPQHMTLKRVSMDTNKHLSTINIYTNCIFSLPSHVNHCFSLCVSEGVYCYVAVAVCGCQGG